VKLRWVVGITSVVILTACSLASPAPTGTSGDVVQGTPREDVPSALDRIDNPALPDPLVDPERIVSGGPPPDGIPPIDEPTFEATGDVDWLADDEPVLALDVGTDSRAYPIQVMIWHEIVNDTVGGRPVSVTYCPLCNSAIAFDRQLDQRVLTFGTSGRLYLSALVMYDRQTESLWSQIEGRAIAGHLTSSELDRLPVQTVTWAQWRSAHPDGAVLSRDTGVTRNYGENPYVGYDAAGSDPFLFDGAADPRLPAKERVVVLGGEVDPVAVTLVRLAEARVLAVEVEGGEVVLWSAAGLRSALDTEAIADGRVLSTTGAFDPMVDGRSLTFVPVGDAEFTDHQTGSTWTILGRATAGPLAGTQLRPVQHLDTFWFAWAAFRPGTRIVA